MAIDGDFESTAFTAEAFDSAAASSGFFGDTKVPNFEPSSSITTSDGTTIGNAMSVKMDDPVSGSEQALNYSVSQQPLDLNFGDPRDGAGVPIEIGPPISDIIPAGNNGGAEKGLASGLDSPPPGSGPTEAITLAFGKGSETLRTDAALAVPAPPSATDAITLGPALPLFQSASSTASDRLGAPELLIPDVPEVKITQGAVVTPNLNGGANSSSPNGGALETFAGFPRGTNQVAEELAKKTAPALTTYPAASITDNQTGQLNPNTGRVNGVVTPAPSAAPDAASNGALTAQDKAIMDRAIERFPVSDKAAQSTGQAQLNEVLKLQDNQARSDQITSNTGAYINNLNAAQTAVDRALPNDATKVAFKNAMDMAMPVTIPVGAPKRPTTQAAVLTSDDLAPSGIGAAAERLAVKVQNSNGLLPTLIDPTGIFRAFDANVIRGVGSLLNEADNALTGAANGGVTLESALTATANTPLSAAKTVNAILGNNQTVNNALSGAGKGIADWLNPLPSTAESLFSSGAANLGGEALLNKGFSETVKLGAPVVGNLGKAVSGLFRSTDEVGKQAFGVNPSGVAQYKTPAMPGGSDEIRIVSWDEFNRVKGAGSGGGTGSGAGNSAGGVGSEIAKENPILGVPRVGYGEQGLGSGNKVDQIKPTKVIGPNGEPVLVNFPAETSATYPRSGQPHAFTEFPRNAAPSHGFPDMVDNYADLAWQFPLQRGGMLYQLRGDYNGAPGRFEWIVNPEMGGVTHRMFIPEGVINAMPSKKAFDGK
jgi:hypothetical protein